MQQILRCMHLRMPLAASSQPGCRRRRRCMKSNAPNVFIPNCFAISFFFLHAYTIYYRSRLKIPMEAALEIVNQTFVSILSGNFICICTGVSMHVGWSSQRNDSLLGALSIRAPHSCVLIRKEDTLINSITLDQNRTRVRQ